MSATEATETPTVERWRHRRTEVDAVRYDGTEHGRRWIVRWVSDHGGEALDRHDGSLWVGTHRGLLPVGPGEFVVHGIEVEGRREWFPLSGKFAALAYYDAHAFDQGAVLSRDQAAAIVLAAQDSNDVAQLREWIRDLAASAEALR